MELENPRQLSIPTGTQSPCRDSPGSIPAAVAAVTPNETCPPGSAASGDGPEFAMLYSPDPESFADERLLVIEQPTLLLSGRLPRSAPMLNKGLPPLPPANYRARIDLPPGLGASG